MTLKRFLGFIAGIICGGIVLVAAIGSSWFTNKNFKTWFNNWGQHTEQADNTDGNDGDNGNTGDVGNVGGGNQSGGDTATSDGKLINQINDNGISLMTSEIAVEDYEDYGISMQADKAYSITATVNEDAIDKSVIGGIAWKNPSSTWASGKDLSEYATLTQTEQYGLNFTLTVKKAFSEPITVQVASVLDSSVYGTCRVDYLKEIQSFTAVLNPSLNSACTARLYVGDTKNTIQIIPNYMPGTVAGTISACSTKFTFHSATVTSLDNALKNVSGSGTVQCKTWFTCEGLEFKVPFSAMRVGGGGNDFWANVDVVMNNYFCLYAYTDNLTSQSAGYNSVIQSIICTITYTYGDSYTDEMTTSIGGTFINKKGLTKIETISDINLGGDITVIPS